MSLTVSLERCLKAPLDIVDDRVRTLPLDQLGKSSDWEIPQMVNSLFKLQSADGTLVHKVSCAISTRVQRKPRECCPDFFVSKFLRLRSPACGVASDPFVERHRSGEDR